MSLLHPYSAARRVACPGSRALEAMYPEQDTDYLIEGKLAHEWAAHLLETKLLCDREYYKIPYRNINRDLITEEIKKGAESYCDYIVPIWVSLGSPLPYIEYKLDISIIHPECSGTPDFFMYGKNQLHIFDYKFGHRPVDAYENWQMIEYAAGILDFLKVDGKYDQVLEVHFHIIQPRSIRQFDTWPVMAVDLRGHFNTLQRAENLSMESVAPCSVSPQCQLCRARHACPTLQRTALTQIEVSEMNMPHNLSPSEIGNELRLLQHAAALLDARVTGLSEQALSLLKSGKYVPHFMLMPTAGRERWKSAIDEVLILGEMLGFDLLKPREAITPKQAVKLGMDEKLIKSYSETLTGALKLVPANNLGAKVFNGKNN